MSNLCMFRFPFCWLLVVLCCVAGCCSLFSVFIVFVGIFTRLLNEPQVIGILKKSVIVHCVIGR